MEGLGISVLLPVISETSSLKMTVEMLEEDSAGDIVEYLFLTAPRTLAASKRICQWFIESTPKRFSLHEQTLPGLGGAIREGFKLVRGTYVLVMASDLETNSRVVPLMIRAVRQGRWDLVSASRWAPAGGLVGYPLVKYVCNWVFQRIFASLYGVDLTDMTYGFRLMRTEMVHQIRWEERFHPFLFETLVKPLRLGYRVTEVPAMWQPRVEGRSSGSLWWSLRYVWMGLKVRFAARSSLLENVS
jgi:glycosyltransferase involved in cell wall biosynthesis